MLTETQGRILLDMARSAIRGKTIIPKEDFLKEKLGVFVTLTRRGSLRGCIGLPYPTTELGKAVVSAAKSAAYKDPRFKPVSADELSDLNIEVSVLSQPKDCKLEEIKKGDGVILEHEGTGALFLPQVWEELPDKKNFLEQLSMKAYLPKDAYKTAKFKKFSVQIFK